MKITIEGNTVDGSARSTLNVVLSGARGPAGEPSPLGVPYTGATQDVNLGEFGLLTGNVEFDTTPTNAPTAAGSMSWNDTDGTLNLVLKGGNVISKLGETQHIRAYNNTGAAITRGKVVYVSGAQGQRLTVALADADTEILSKDTIGFTAESIAEGAEGFVIIAGVLSNMNTSGMADGATVYLSQTAGGYTTTPPVDPAHLVILGFIVNGGSGGAGSIYVKVDNGYELEELHGVADAAKVTPVGADALLLRDSADNDLWKRLTWTNALAGVKTHMDTFKGVAGGYASLDGSGKIPSSELPSYVDDVVEAASFAALPVTGETGKIYVTLDNNKCYRWSGSAYIEISAGGGIDTLTTTGTSGAATLVGSTLNIPQYQSVLTNPVTGTGTSGQVAYWSGTTTQTGSNNLFWDIANNRLGIGTNAPSNDLHIESANAFIRVVRPANEAGITATTSSSNTTGFTIRSLSDRLGLRIVAPNDANNEWIRIFGLTKNVSIGLNTDASARLTVRGSGTTSATTALLVQNSSGNQIINIDDSGQFQLGNQSLRLMPTGNGATVGLTGRGLLLETSIGTATVGEFTITGSINSTSANLYTFRAASNFIPTSGTATYSGLWVTTTINQTGGANGITRGLYVNPTLTSAADWRSVETSNNTGWAIYAGGTANSYFGGNVGIGGNDVGYALYINSNNGIGVRSVVSSTVFMGNAQGSNTASLELQSLGVRRLRILSTATSTTFESSNQTANFAFNRGVNITGSGTTSATTALLVQNSTPSALFQVRDDATLLLGTTGNTNIYPSNNNSTVSANGRGFVFNTDLSTLTDCNLITVRSGNMIQTSGTNNGVNVLSIFAPPSGNAQYRDLLLSPTINQTGGANGITRGLYLNPTLTAAADWRGIESVAASNANHTLLKLRNATVDVFTVKADSKIGFFNATPVAQPTTGIAEVTFVENSGGTAVNVDSTFAGYTIQQIAQALKDIGLLA